MDRIILSAYIPERKYVIYVAFPDDGFSAPCFRNSVSTLAMKILAKATAIFVPCICRRRISYALHTVSIPSSCGMFV